MSTNLTTGIVRLSYVHLFEPYAMDNQSDAKYCTTILVPKTDTATKAAIDAAIQEAITQGIATNSNWKGTPPPSGNTPVYDGDGYRQNGEPFGDECKGHWVMTASSKQPQEIVDVRIQPILDKSQIYSGIYAHVNINFYPYYNSGKKGIGCGLGPVMKVKDGEPLGGRVTAAEAFKGFAPAIQQPSYTTPAIDPITGMPIQ